MAVAFGGTCVTFPAKEDLSGRQYTFVELDTNGLIADGAAGATCVGILQNKPAAANRAAVVQIDGVSKLKVAGTTTQGDRLKTDGDGLGVVTTTATDNVGAVALEDGAANAYIAVRVLPYSFGA